MSIAERLMVCVTRQKTCERLIDFGAKISKERGIPLEVIHVVKSGENFMGDKKEGEALEYLYQTSNKFDAEMTVIRAEDVIDTLVNHARENNAVVIIVGRGPGKEDNKIHWQLKSDLPGVEILCI